MMNLAGRAIDSAGLMSRLSRRLNSVILQIYTKLAQRALDKLVGRSSSQLHHANGVPAKPAGT